MPRTMWKGAISFGLVSIPIRVFPATEEKTLRFNQLHDKDGGRIKYQRVCSIDGEEVSFDHIVKGYEVEKDHYVMLDDESIDAFREAVWGLTALITVRTRRPGSAEADPMALPRSATVRDVAAKLHNELAETIRSARVWGPSARYPGQRVGRTHVVSDGDLLELDTTEP